MPPAPRRPASSTARCAPSETFAAIRAGVHRIVRACGDGEAVLVAQGDPLADDAKPGVDGRDDVRDVAHVGASGADCTVSLSRVAAQGSKVRSEAARQGHVVDHVAIALSRGDLDVHVARHGGCPRASFDDAPNAIELGPIGRANAELACGALRDDVDSLSAVADVAVDTYSVAEVDALPIDETERIEASRESAAAGVRGNGGVRRSAAKIELEPQRGECRVREEVTIERVEHHGRVDTVEDAGLDHGDLASSALLGGRPQEHDLAAGFVGMGQGGSCSHERSGRSCRDEVVSTSMPHARQGIVLGEDGDPRALGLGGRDWPARTRNAVGNPAMPRSTV